MRTVVPNGQGFFLSGYPPFLRLGRPEDASAWRIH